MFKKIVLAACLVFMPMASQAALISYNGYERDINSSTVKGGGLDWLMWDVTKGKTISDALAEYSGWRLASNREMGDLFNAFGFGRSHWVSNESVGEYAETPHSPNVEGAHAKFMDLFGNMVNQSCALSMATRNCYSDTDPYRHVSALYGSDENENGFYNLAQIVDDYTYLRGLGFSGVSEETSGHAASLHYDGFPASLWYVNFGVALVRPSDSVSPPSINAPSAFSLLMLGLLALKLRRR